MSKLPLCSSEQIITALLKDGFQPRSKPKSGSHQVYLKPISGQRTRVVVVPSGKKQVPRGTLLSIINQAGLTREYFLNLLE
jgi:predicted RNA binding protein YcfA (HicA-like mRNA interferase family)